MTFTVLFYLSRLAVRAFQFHFKRSDPEIEYFILYHELPHRLKEKYILKCQLQRNVLATRICLGNHVSNTCLGTELYSTLDRSSSCSKEFLEI